MLASQSLSSTSSASFIRTKCSEIPRGPCIINYKQSKTIVLTAFSVLKGLGALESFSHSSMAVCHWATNSTVIVSSKLWKANIWSLCIGAASWILFINAEPYQTYRVSGWPEAWRWKNTLPNLIIFFPIPITKVTVQCIMPGTQAHFFCTLRSRVDIGPSPFRHLAVGPPNAFREVEWILQVTCAGKWNFGTRKRTDLTLLDRASSGGKIFICSQRFLCHWHAMS